MKEKIFDMVSKYGLTGMNAAVGFAWGSIDIATTGYPFFSLGGEIWRSLAYRNIIKESPEIDISRKEKIGFSLAHLGGASIPFAIMYKEQIYNFLEGILK
jgi:hypothetical protein